MHIWILTIDVLFIAVEFCFVFLRGEGGGVQFSRCLLDTFEVVVSDFRSEEIIS